MKHLLILLFLSIINISCAQENKQQLILGEKYAKEVLEETLKNNRVHNVIDNKTPIIKNDSTAITVAESILFEIYGENNIINQRPYKIHKIENYYVISGTLPKNYVGGTFLIIINSLNSEIIRITHGK
ncbi:MAG TPA: NTF2 fold immunity protein [Faecalibacter sp.]